MPGIYADLYFFMNGAIDYILLYSAARLADHPIQTARLLPAALAGALYATLGLWDLGVWGGFFYSPWGKVGFFLLWMIAAYYPVHWKRLAQLSLYVYAAASLVAGISIAFSLFGTQYWFDSWLRWQGIPWWQVVLIACVAGLSLHRLWHWASDRQTRRRSICEVELHWQGKCRMIKGLLDTGHQLRDPISHDPVLIIEKAVLSPWLPASVSAAINGMEDIQAVAASLQDDRWAKSFRLLPYKSVGKTRGWMPGFRIDRIRVQPAGAKDSAWAEKKFATIALFPGKLSDHDEYRALVHPEFLSAGTDRRESGRRPGES